MKISIGNPVQGDDFFDREVEQKSLWRKLERDHILMLAPRRIGKTSLLLRLCETAETRDQLATYCSFSPCNDELDCVQHLIKAVGENKKRSQQFIEKLSDRLKRIKGIKVAGLGIEFDQDTPPDWRQLGEELANTLDALGDPWLIAVDELPVFVLSLLKQENGEARVRGFLNWFRDLRQKHYKQVRWIAAGSIGLDTVASRLNLGDAINDFHPFPLGAFDRETAMVFIDRLATSYDLSIDKQICGHMIDRVGWPVPYYLQLLFDTLLDQCETKGAKPSTKQVDTAFESLLSPTYKIHFDYWKQRLHEELGKLDASYAIRLLNAACHDNEGAGFETLSQSLSTVISDVEKKEEKLRYLLDILVNDGYLVELDARYRFRLEWLREYWKRRIAK